MQRLSVGGAIACWSVVFGVAARAPSQDRPQKEFERIRAEAFASDRSASFLAHLCDRIGPRPTGSAAHALAVEWVAGQLRDAGLSVTTETETLPHAWQPGPVKLRIVAPVVRTLDAVAAPFTPGLSAAVELRLRIAPPDHEEGIDAGVAVLVDPDAVPLQPRRVHPYAKAGLLLIDSARPRALLASEVASFAAPFAAGMVPACFVTAEDAGMLRRLLASGDTVTIHAEGGGTLLGETHCGEVIADLPGSGVDLAAATRDDALVLTLAGLDSATLGTGATMNGAGVAVLAEVARILKDLGRAPRRTIRFAFVAGTTEGAGSSFYAARHASELARHRFAFALEGGAGRVRGLAMDGVQSDLERFERFFEPVRDLGATDVGFRGPRTGLSRALKEQKVRAFTFVQEAPEFGLIDATPADTFDKVPLHDLQESVCVVATALWAAANEDS